MTRLRSRCSARSLRDRGGRADRRRSNVLACAMCFGAEETSMIDGAKLGVLVMLAVLFAVQGAFVAFFLYLRKRAKRIADVELDDEWSELQRAPRTS